MFDYITELHDGCSNVIYSVVRADGGVPGTFPGARGPGMIRGNDVMPTDSRSFGERLRELRRSSGFTQAQVAEHIGVSRSTLAHIETGRRPVRAEEIGSIAEMLGRAPADLFPAETGAASARDGPRTRSGLLEDLSRLSGGPADRREMAAILRLAEAVQETESVLGLDLLASHPAEYGSIGPGTAWEAVYQGYRVAEAERLRLALGEAPIRSMDDLLASSRVRTARVRLPARTAGLFLRDPMVGTLVIVSRALDLGRRRFGYAHGLAHAVLDGGPGWRVCRGEDDPALPEIRASAFASAFLLPERGARRYLEALGKEALGRGGAVTLDVAIPGTGSAAVVGSLRIDGRGRRGRHPINLNDLARMASYFGVSRSHALLRLRNLRFVTEGQLELLQRQHGEADSQEEGGAPSRRSSSSGSAALRERLAALVAEARARDVVTREAFDARMDIARVSMEEREALLERARRVL